MDMKWFLTQKKNPRQINNSSRAIYLSSYVDKSFVFFADSHSLYISRKSQKLYFFGLVFIYIFCVSDVHFFRCCCLCLNSRGYVYFYGMYICTFYIFFCCSTHRLDGYKIVKFYEINNFFLLCCLMNELKNYYERS